MQEHRQEDAGMWLLPAAQPDVMLDKLSVAQS